MGLHFQLAGDAQRILLLCFSIIRHRCTRHLSIFSSLRRLPFFIYQVFTVFKLLQRLPLSRAPSSFFSIFQLRCASRLSIFSSRRRLFFKLPSFPRFKLLQRLLLSSAVTESAHLVLFKIAGGGGQGKAGVGQAHVRSRHSFWFIRGKEFCRDIGCDCFHSHVLVASAWIDFAPS